MLGRGAIERGDTHLTERPFRVNPHDKCSRALAEGGAYPRRAQKPPPQRSTVAMEASELLLFSSTRRSKARKPSGMHEDQSHCSVRWRAISSIDSRSRSASIAPMHPVPAAVIAWR